MQKRNIYHAITRLALFLLLLSFGACQQMQEGEWDDEEAERHELKIQARARGEALIDYPLYLYAFAEDGHQVASQIIEDDSQSIQLHLPSGAYQITAFSGVSDDYQFPKTIEKDGTIKMPQSGFSTHPMMMGKADVTINSKKTTSLNLTLSYVVSAVSVTLSGIGSEANEVTLKLSPLYSALALDGTYASADKVVEIPCQRNKDGKWESETVYVFPGSGSETVFSIRMQTENQSESTYSYVFHGKPLANRPFVVNGNYTGEIVVDGDYIAQDWGEPIFVDFDFGATGGSETPVEPGEIDVAYVNKLPESGTIWNHTLVALVTPITEKEEEVVLLSLDEWLQPVSMAEEVKKGYSVNGIKNWRLPTFDEAKKLQGKWVAGGIYDVNDQIVAYDPELVQLDDNDRYLCEKEGKYYSFVIVSDNSPSVAGTKKEYLIRLAKTYKLKVR